MTPAKVRTSGLDPRKSVQGQYDLAIASIGFESRGRYVVETLRPISEAKVAFEFQKQQELSFADNLAFFKTNGFNVIPAKRDTLERMFETGALLDWLPSSRRSASCLRIIVDISSMNRHMLGCTVAALWKLAADRSVSVDFVYAVAAYVRPGKEMEQILTAGPVLPEFAGWTPPDKPTAAIIGLGYELHRAIGLIEFLEPAEVWVFQGQSDDRKYDAQVRRANKLLFDSVVPENLINYAIRRPLECYLTLESLIAGVSMNYRPVLIPFGPKIFALCTLLVALRHYPTVAVWRVSSDEAAEPTDRHASGKLYGLRSLFSGLE